MMLAVEALVDTFSGPDNDTERGMLVGSLLAHCVAIPRVAAQAAGVPTDKIIGSVHASLISEDGKR